MKIVGAQLAMAGVIDADEIIDSGRGGSLQLAGVKLAFVRRHGRERVAPVADARLFENSAVMKLAAR
jgi:hypothetical protein